MLQPLRIRDVDPAVADASPRRATRGSGHRSRACGQPRPQDRWTVHEAHRPRQLVWRRWQEVSRSGHAMPCGGSASAASAAAGRAGAAIGRPRAAVGPPDVESSWRVCGRLPVIDAHTPSPRGLEAHREFKSFTPIGAPLRPSAGWRVLDNSLPRTSSLAVPLVSTGILRDELRVDACGPPWSSLDNWVTAFR